MPHADLRVIVPNGLVKIVIPFRNGLKASMAGRDIISMTHEVTVIGIADIPSVVVDLEEKASGAIGIEFNPWGAYRFLNPGLHELTNQVYSLTDVMPAVSRLQEQLSNIETVTQKVAFVQQFLRHRFTLGTPDEIFEYCARKIRETQGRISISVLERQTGYSARWLNMKFQDRIGISPKTLCSIVRFQHVYRHWAMSNFASYDRADVYSFYHDQAHFIKDFKRFTGYSPVRFQVLDNDFGRLFYRG